MYPLHRLRFDIHPSICHLSSDLRLSQNHPILCRNKQTCKMAAKPSCTSTQLYCKDPLGFEACIYHYTSAPKSHCVPSSKQKHQFSKRIVARLQKFACLSTIPLCRCFWLFLTRITCTFKLGVPVLVWHQVGGQRNWSENGWWWWEGGGATKGCSGLQGFLLCPIADSSFHGTK